MHDAEEGYIGAEVLSVDGFIRPLLMLAPESGRLASLVEVNFEDLMILSLCRLGWIC
jgi:hypothetical protein